MMSRIEQLISEIEEYIDSCRFQALSNSKIIVNKEELEELLVELRLRIPDEIKKYQKIISQQETILGEARSQADEMLEDAKRQADSMVAQASEQTSEMINEHEIMQRAYAHANEVVSRHRRRRRRLWTPLSMMPTIFARVPFSIRTICCGASRPLSTIRWRGPRAVLILL